MTPEMLKMLQAMSLGEKNPDGADKTLDEMMKKDRRFEVNMLSHALVTGLTFCNRRSINSRRM
jgi:hypothetical protein